MSSRLRLTLERERRPRVAPKELSPGLRRSRSTLTESSEPSSAH